jgi:hypothetical protein
MTVGTNDAEFFRALMPSIDYGIDLGSAIQQSGKSATDHNCDTAFCAGVTAFYDFLGIRFRNIEEISIF